MKYVKFMASVMASVVLFSCSKEIAKSDVVNQKKSSAGFSEVQISQEVANAWQDLDWEGQAVASGEFQYEGYGAVPFQFVKSEAGIVTLEVESNGLAAVLSGEGYGTDCVYDPIPCDQISFMTFQQYIDGIKGCATWWCAVAVTVQMYDDCFNASPDESNIHCW